MLRKIRIALAAIMMTMAMLLFLDFTGTLHAWLGWVAKIQFLPALLALNVGVVVALVALTLVFGRIYCSVVCPLGIMQDIVSSARRKPLRFSYSPEKRWLRYGMLALFVVAMVAGFTSAAALIAPYSSFGRIAQNLLQPIYIGANNLLAALAARADSYAFYERDVWIRSLPTFLIALGTFVVIAALALRSGRTYCNTICPVGTVLGLLSRLSLIKVRIDAGKCRNCQKCARSCKASAIDIKHHRVDYSRCVACGNCLEQCQFDSIKYSPAPRAKAKPAAADMDASGAPDSGRRAFLVGAALSLAGAAMAQEKKKVDGGLAAIADKEPPMRRTALTPPGSLSAQHMAQHCTACQLCVAQCPNDVLRPSSDLSHFMQPEMSFERGYCRPECNTCSQVCPTGAIRPITLAQRSSTQTGHAVWQAIDCVPVADGKPCGNCARHCPVGAITMVAQPGKGDDAPKVPAVNEARCIGCGACENVCPARPFSAIYVEGHEVHREV